MAITLDKLLSVINNPKVAAIYLSDNEFRIQPIYGFSEERKKMYGTLDVESFSSLVNQLDSSGADKVSLMGSMKYYLGNIRIMVYPKSKRVEMYKRLESARNAL